MIDIRPVGYSEDTRTCTASHGLLICKRQVVTGNCASRHEGCVFVPFNEHRLNRVGVQFEHHRFHDATVLGTYDSSPICLTLWELSKTFFDYKLQRRKRDTK